MQRDVAGALADCYFRNKKFRGRGNLSNKIDIAGKTFGGTNTLLQTAGKLNRLSGTPALSSAGRKY